MHVVHGKVVGDINACTTPWNMLPHPSDISFCLEPPAPGFNVRYSSVICYSNFILNHKFRCAKV